MQMFFLKNMVSVSIAALLFSAISIGTVAEQEPEPESGPDPKVDEMSPGLASSIDEDSSGLDMSNKTAEIGDTEEVAPLPMPEETKPSAMKPIEEASPELPKLNKESESSVYQEMLEGETNPLEIPEGTPESRVQKRLEVLNDLDEGVADQNSPAESTEPSQNDVSPASPQNDVVPHMAGPQAAASAPESVAAKPAPVAEADAPTAEVPAVEEEVITPPTPSTTESAIPESDPALTPAPEDVDPALEALTLAPEASRDSEAQAYAGDLVTPINSTMNAVIIKPKGNMAPKAWDDEEDRPVPKKEDSDSPTSEGQGPHGKHKGGPKMALSKVRIIRMGEDVPQDSGFTFLHPNNR